MTTTLNIAVLGTGTVGQVLATKLVELGHQVSLGSRSADNPKATEWAAKTGGRAATFADAAASAELVINAVSGQHSLAALDSAAAHLEGKVLIDVANPLDFSKGFPPTLSVCNDDSLAEQIQRAHPRARVVKALNTVANPIMVNPSVVPGEHVLPICGDDDQAKAAVAELLKSFGWRETQLLDMGALSQARGTEAWLLLWTRLYGKLGTGLFNLVLARGEA